MAVPSPAPLRSGEHESRKALGKLRILVGEQRDRKQGRVGRPASPIAKVATGTPLGHLDDGQQRVLAGERARLDRHAEHRQGRLGGDHARQMRRPPAPAMIAFEALPRAVSAYSNIRSGVRCADTTRAS